MKKTLKRHGQAEAIATDGLPSYPGAMNELGVTELGEMGRGLNDHFNQERHPIDRQTSRHHHSAAMPEWQSLMG